MTTGGEVETLDWLPDAAWIIDGDGIVEGCNAMAARLLARPKEQIIGQPAEEVVALSDASGDSWWAQHRPLDGDAALITRIPETELTLTDAHGRRRPVIVTAARHAGEHGRVARMALCARRAERRQRLDAARSDLVSTVSHELRSPLTSVKGFTKTLLAKWDRFTDEQKQQMLATVNEDADRVTRLLGELLDVSRIDAGRVQLHRRMVDLADVVRRVTGRIPPDQLDQSGRRIEVDLDPELPQIYADPDKIEQVLTNLLENALRYGEGTVRITGELEEDHVRITVSDEGPGIPASMHAQMFTKFFRRAGQRTGTGLGLYITKGMVQAHGGTIALTSPPEGGAAFTFTLPRGGLELAGIDFDALHRGAL